MSPYYEEYKRRLKVIAGKLPENYLIHYVDYSGRRRIATEPELIAAMCDYYFSRELDHALYAPEGEKPPPCHYIRSIDTADLIIIESRSPILQLLLMEDSYYPAEHVLERDPATWEQRELSLEELKAYDAMTETEREAYWKKREAAFFDHMTREEEKP